MSPDDTDEKAAVEECPHAARATGIPIREEMADAVPVMVAPELMPISQVERLLSPDNPLRITAAWMRSFLGRPHRELGRPGPVCPFVPGAIMQDTIWLGQVSFGPSDKQAIVEAIGMFRDMFRNLEPVTGDLSMMKAIMIVFPNIDIDNAGVIDEVQGELKAKFVADGLMIGEFHERNESPGLRNENFRPLRSPIPGLAIRFMVDTDLPFLKRMTYPPPLRAEFIRSYLRRMLADSMNRVSIDAALDALVGAEIEMRGGESDPKGSLP
jgi:hypothetical protein